MTEKIFNSDWLEQPIFEKGNESWEHLNTQLCYNIKLYHILRSYKGRKNSQEASGTQTNNAVFYAFPD